MKKETFVIGLSGRIGSGKSSVANVLSYIYDGEVVPIASGLKGLSLFVRGPTVFFPQRDVSSRQFLQSLGVVGRKTDPFLWCKIVYSYMTMERDDEPLGETRKVFIVPDVRYENEIQFFKTMFGEDKTVFIYLSGELGTVSVPDEVKSHPSENLPPELCDFVVPVGDGFIQTLRQCIKHIQEKTKLEPSPRKPVLYLGTNMSFSDEFNFILDSMVETLEDFGYTVVEPRELTPDLVWSDSVRNGPFKQASDLLVCSILNSLTTVDGGVFVLTGPSIGASMEILSLIIMNKPTIVITNLSLLYHPWLHLATDVIWDSQIPKLSEYTLGRIRNYIPLPEDILG